MRMEFTLKYITNSILLIFALSSVANAAPSRMNTTDTEPATCTVGDLWIDTNGTAGNSVYTCTAADTWTLLDTRHWVAQTTAPADTTLLWFDTDQVAESIVLKVYTGGVWVPHAVGSSSGDNLGSATYSNVVALWTTCTGYLKSDGTCDTPSGSATYPSAAGVANWNGSAWGTSYTVGTAANNLVQLNGTAQLPAVSGALLTGSFTGTLIGSQTTISGAIQTIGTELDGQDELLFDSDDFTETAGTGTVTVSIDKSAVEATQPSTLALTTDTSITEANLLSSKYLSNYGASGEVDIILPAISYNQTRTILIEAAHVLEISPPSGEVLELSGTDLTADYCVNSGSVVGNKATATRIRTGASTWKWSIDVVRGTWASCGAASD